MTISKVHITGGPGSGKTTLSRQIAASLNVACYELDALALELEATGQPFSNLADEAQRISTSDGWVSDGAYFDWTEPLFQNSDLVI
jgi:adenylate kinase family enzyme